MKEYAELENFIRKHYAALYTSALKFVKSEAVAQDIVQEIIIRYWENQEKYNTIESIENFLFVSVKNEALNYLQGHRKGKQPLCPPRKPGIRGTPDFQFIHRRRNQPDVADRYRPATGTKCPNHPSGLIRFGK